MIQSVMPRLLSVIPTPPTHLSFHLSFRISFTPLLSLLLHPPPTHPSYTHLLLISPTHTARESLGTNGGMEWVKVFEKKDCKTVDVPGFDGGEAVVDRLFRSGPGVFRYDIGDDVSGDIGSAPPPGTGGGSTPRGSSSIYYHRKSVLPPSLSVYRLMLYNWASKDNKLGTILPYYHTE